jgi:hypothetical protein
MRNHFEDFWGLYLVVAIIAAIFTLLVIADQHHRQAVSACYDQGKILVDTDAGWRCASLLDMGDAA